MFRLRYRCGVMIVALCAGLAIQTARADDDETAAERLSKAIKMYDGGQYQDALTALEGIKDDDLENEDQQLQLQRYLAQAQKAVDSIRDAAKSLKEGGAALKDGKLEAAKSQYEKVLANKFATPEMKNLAADQLKVVDAQMKAPAEAPKKSEPVREQPRTEPVKRETPPVAREERSQIIEAPAAPRGGTSIVEQLSEEHDLLWQQAVRTYRDTETKIRKAVLAEDFDEARRLLDFAKQTLELNRRYASPPGRYEDLRNQATELERFVEDEDRDYQERQIFAKQKEIEQQENERVQRLQATKIRQVEQLMEQAAELRKERRYDDAIQVLKQVLAIDPENNQAAWMKDTIEDFSSAARDRDHIATRESQAQDALIENDAAMIPWHKDIMYPKNWPE
ncbi:MAG TPA: hypothetical protein VMV81_00220, partial [Phycisphaerae bacterium]|nr:hypothetical protein [Phycisphaerae bacterium]